jgi:hypothetical protein
MNHLQSFIQHMVAALGMFLGSMVTMAVLGDVQWFVLFERTYFQVAAVIGIWFCSRFIWRQQ